MAPYKSESQINFTGIIVTFNEERYLSDCLNGLKFCDQLIVIDLGSSDSSPVIATSYGAELIRHERVFCQEEVRPKFISSAKNEWIVSIDPDEILPDKIEDTFRLHIREDPKLGSISLPWIFHFKGKPLNSTIWGIEKEKAILSHKYRNTYTPNIHRGVSLLEGYTSLSLQRNNEYYIKHYWVDSYLELIEKHLRYLRINVDGKSRYNNGERFTFRRWAKETIYGLKINLFDYKGIIGGRVGIFLSVFYAWYVSMSLLSLLRYQRRVINNRI